MGLRKARYRRADRGSGKRWGSTFVELSIAMTLLVLVVGGLGRVLVAALASSGQGAQHLRASEAARSMLEELHAQPFAQLFALYNEPTSDDPAGVEAPGAGFAVQGLDALAGDEDGLPGEIVFPTVALADGEVELREDVDLPALGMPRDLTGDGDVDDVDHAGDYRILPVIVRVRWRGKAAGSSVEIKTLIVEY